VSAASSSLRVVTTGFMGAGKSTVAAILAQQLNCEMLDLDEFLIKREGRTIRAIIDEDGEPQFREAETRALREALENNSASIIALGGGTWTLECNRALIAEHNYFTVWLDAPFELCWHRITSGGNSTEGNIRPLARNRDAARKLYQQRRVLYGLATLRVEADAEKDLDYIVATIINAAKIKAAL